MEPGDSILCEEYTYPHVPESLVSPVGYHSVAVRIDEDGVIPQLLRETLEGMQSRGEKLPRLLYTVPVGQNPTGGLAALHCTVINCTICAWSQVGNCMKHQSGHQALPQPSFHGASQVDYPLQ